MGSPDEQCSADRARARKEITELQDAQKHIEELRETLAKMQRQRDSLAAQLADIRSSRLWRLTRPLRALGASIKRRSGDAAPPPLLRGSPDDMGQLVLRTVTLDLPVWEDGKPLVSVVISGAAAQHAGATVESVRQQTLEPVETLVVPPQAGQSAAEASNQGIGQARGKYICCLQAGDTLQPTYLEKCVTAMEGNPGIGFVYPWVQVTSGEPHLWKPELFDLNRLARRNLAPACAVFRRSEWQLVGGFWTGARPDYVTWDFWLSLAEAGLRGHRIPEHLCSQSAPGEMLHTPAVGNGNVQVARRHARLQLPAERAAIVKGYYNAHVKEALCSLSRAGAFKQSSTPNRVLFMASWLLPGGAETWLYDLISGLRQGGRFECYLLTTRPNENVWHDYFLNATPYIYHLPNLLLQDVWIDFLANLVHTRQIQTIVLSLPPWGYDTLPTIRRLLPDVRIMDVLHSDLDSGYLQRSILRDQYIDKHIVINPQIGDRLQTVYHIAPEKIVLAYNGIDVDTLYDPARYAPEAERAQWGISTGQRVVTWIGRLSIEKQPVEFVHIAADLKKRKDTVFVMVGDGPVRDLVREQVQQARLGSSMRLLGAVAADKIPGILSCSDIFVLTSVFEGGPRVVLEALAMGVPVVSYDVGHVADIVQDGVNGFVVERGQADLLSQRVRELLDDPALLARCKANARQSVLERGFTLQHMIDRWSDILTS